MPILVKARNGATTCVNSAHILPKKEPGMKPKRRIRRRPMDLRTETQRQLIARLLLLGCTAEEIARKLGRTSRAIRYLISKPEFETLFAALQQEQLRILDRKMSSLLHAALKALAK